MNAPTTPNPIRKNDTVWVLDPDTRGPSAQWEIGRASCRERV